MNTRHRYRIIIAMDNALHVDIFAHAIAREFSRRFGGCTVLPGKGYWAPDGSQDLAVYAKPMIEDCRVVEVVTVEEETLLIQKLMHAAASKVASVEIEVINQWIHFEYEAISCSHFQI